MADPIPYIFGLVGLLEGGAYGQQLVNLLPPGRLWHLAPLAKLRALLNGIGDELERVRARAYNMIAETDPRTAAETLGDWERVLGLPDEQVPVLPGTVEERQTVVTAKYVAQGGQDPAYFANVAAQAGWPLLSIDKFADKVFRVHTGRCGDRLYGALWAYTIRLNLGTPAANALSKPDFERLIRYITHDHYQVIFTYA